MNGNENKQKSTNPASDSFSRLYSIIKQLRAPDGCPWDREQTIESLSPQLVEECYELIDAIQNSDLPNQREEIGDMFLVLLMLSTIYEEHRYFSLADSLKEVSEKLIRRHPHVFSDHKVTDRTEVVALWDRIKKDVEKKEKKPSTLSSIKKSIPPLEKAFNIQKKASKSGFDWDNIVEVFKKIDEELEELNQAIESQNQLSIEEEFGDLLFSVINLGRFLKTDPSLALNRCNNKFMKRFQFMEEKMRKSEISLSKENMRQMELFWIESKDA